MVLDASVAAVWLLDDETNSVADAALVSLAQNGAIVPQLWHAEIRNCLLVAERRGRLDVSDTDKRLDILGDLPIQTDTETDYNHALHLARQHKLSLYDALYLELAIRLKTTLCSLDKTLIRAAGVEGVQAGLT